MGLNTTPATWASGAVVTAAQMNTEVRDAITGIQSTWTSWTPTVSAGLTVGNGTWTGAYKQVGKDMVARFSFTLGSTSAVTAGVFLNFPVAINTTEIALTCCGSAFFYGGSTANKLAGSLLVNSTSTGGVGSFGLATPTGQINTTVPFTWATGHVLSGKLIYEAA